MRILGLTLNQWRRRFTGSGGAATAMSLNYVNGPADGVSTDNALVRWDGATGRLVQNSGATLSDAGALALPVGGGLSLANVGGATPEGVELVWAANVATLRTVTTGGSTRNLSLASLCTLVLGGTGNGGCTITNTGAGITVPGLNVTHTNAMQSTNNLQTSMSITGTVNQASGTGGYNALLINPTLTAVGSAGANFINAQEAGTSRFRVDANGRLLLGVHAAPQAGGTRMIGMTNTTVGIFVGSGAPTASATKGSLYLRTDGSGTNDRAYINTDGGTTWTALVTVA
jgi:hypothetical protein